MDIIKDLKLLNEELNTTDLSVGLNRARFIKRFIESLVNQKY